RARPARAPRGHARVSARAPEDLPADEPSRSAQQPRGLRGAARVVERAELTVNGSLSALYARLVVGCWGCCPRAARDQCGRAPAPSRSPLESLSIAEQRIATQTGVLSPVPQVR